MFTFVLKVKLILKLKSQRAEYQELLPPICQRKDEQRTR